MASTSITITVDEWVFEEIISKKPESKSRSEWVQELIIKGYPETKKSEVEKCMAENKEQKKK